MTQAQNTSNVQILKVGHALVEGVRGAQGGAPSKDSVWGIATIQGNVVAFSGRRGGALRFTTHKKVEIDSLHAKWERKVTGKDKWFSYKDITNSDQLDELLPNLKETVKKQFYTAMAKRKLNIHRKAPVAS